ncbi:hypothetical protein JG688_00016331 [Phytophthora aleatoria]|uniref:Uncharacterized protein n=1 Tax=Phytophthora aleatoria TaxID=2496075 RepID=A0A8J5I4H4_9STRA|nr:hypothetical protein JG688_00016331 [Phytophthora aleatoria]
MDAASEPATTPPQAPTPQRRNNYSEEDDIALLRQVLLDCPFGKPRGNVMQHCNTLAATLVASPAFARSKLIGKNGQSRMNQLVITHGEATKEAALLSGVSEEVSEKDQLLDELAELLDDAKHVHECTKKEEQKKHERDEEASLVARRVATVRLVQSSAAEEEGSPPKKPAEQARLRIKESERMMELLDVFTQRLVDTMHNK